MKTPPRLAPWTILLCATMAPATALAQAQAIPREAENLYAQAAAAMIKKEYATACPKFEQVTRLVPDGGGVRLNLAQCYEAWGKLASALGQFVIAEALAKKDNRKDRLQTATRGIDRVRPKVAMLIVSVPDSVRSAPDLAIKLDGELVSERQWGTPTPVDTGAHSLVATARGYKSTTVQVDIKKDGTTTSTSVPALEPAPVEPVAAPTASAVAPPPPHVVIVREESVFTPQVRTATLIAGGALALGGIVGGGVSLGVSAAKANEKSTAERDPYGENAAVSASRAQADATSAAIWCFAGGGFAAVGTVVFLLTTRPKANTPVKAGAFVGPRGPALYIEGHF